MNTSQAIAMIYEIAKDELGSEDAKKTVAGIVFSVITELEAANAPVTEANISKSISFIAQGFIRAAGRQVA